MKRFTMVLGAGMFSILCSMILALVPSVAEGDVPKLINFQGLLRDGSGNPVVNGVYVIRFRIYDDSTAGSNLWEEFDDVQTTNGLFNVRLGDTTDLPNGLFEGSVNRFVGVKVGGDPESSPRTRLISVPFAFHALKSDSAATATVVDHDGLAQVIGELRADAARDRVHRSAGGERHDQPDRPVRVALRLRGENGCYQQHSEQQTKPQMDTDEHR